METGLTLAQFFFADAVPDRAKEDAMLKTMLCAAAAVLMTAFSPAQAAKLDAAAVARLKADAENGNALAQTALGDCYAAFRLCAGIQHDAAKARMWFEKAAAQGDAEAQYNLGVMHAKGQGARKDYARARELWEKAAAQGHSLAQYNLGVMYNNGEGVWRDLKKAREWYGKACENGLQQGCAKYRELTMIIGSHGMDA